MSSLNETFGLFLTGMEAIWRVEVVDFPAFIVVDNKGNDFFKEWQVD
jgi:fumarate hydratase, class I